jgi:undecaprenyl-diphosphatase
MNAESDLAGWMIGIGLLLILTGLLHLVPIINRWDIRTFLFLHTRLRGHSPFFRFIWPLGTTPVGITLILIIFIVSWQAGLIVSLIYLFAALLEAVIKLKVGRKRPFESLPDVKMTQPKRPQDPSHPSGDTMRVWFIALIFPLSFALPWPIFVATITVAIILGLGRIVLGVHYPLDVIGGTGLGLLATGITLASYQLFAF